jgi:hypothetical protein
MLHRTYKIQLFQPAPLVRVWGRRKGGLVGGRQVRGRRAVGQQVVQFRGIPALTARQVQLYQNKKNTVKDQPSTDKNILIKRLPVIL